MDLGGPDTAACASITRGGIKTDFWKSTFLYRQLRIPPPKANLVYCDADIRTDDGQACRKARYRAEEVAKENQDAVEFDQEADERPLHEDEGQAGEEGGGALGFLLAREEEERLLRADDDGEADEEEDLEERSVSDRGRELGG